MKRGTVKVLNPTGFNLYPAGKLSEEAARFKDTKISFRKGTTFTEAKSLLAILGSGVKFGDEIEFFCEGPDEDAALEAMITAVRNRLGE